MEKETKMTSKYNGFITKNDNYVWAGAMCLAWNQLKNKIIKQPIKLNSNDKQVLQTVENFNSERFKQGDIDSKCIYIKSGFGPATLKQINTEVKQKFPQKSFDPIEVDLQDDSIISYAYLLKKLQFVSKFDKLPEKNLLFNGQLNVDGFCAGKKQHRKQIKLVKYTDKENFSLAIQSKNPQDLLFVIKSEKELTIQDAFSMCNQQKLTKIGDKDQFVMPVIDFDLKRTYQNLKLPVLNKQYLTYRIEQMFQNIKLRVDESGAKVENQAVIAMNRCMMRSPQQPKQFILDKPFWLIMKQTGKHPYFAAFIKNPIDKSK